MTNFGDAEAAVAAILRADPRHNDVPVATDLIGYTSGRWLRVTRTGGIPTLWMRLDNPTIAVAAYADSKGDALDLASSARSAIHRARGAYVGNGLALYDVMDIDGLSWSPDETNPGIARYVLSLALITKPYEEAAPP